MRLMRHLFVALVPVAASAAPVPTLPPAMPPAMAAPQRPPQFPVDYPIQTLAGLKIASLHQLDETLDALHRTSWQLYTMFGPLVDVRGRTAGQDVDRWLLTPENAARLDALRAEAAAELARGSQGSLPATLNTVMGLVQREAYMSNLLSDYWTQWAFATRHIATLQEIAAKLSPPAPPRDAAADVIAARVASDLEVAMGATSPGDQSTHRARLNSGHLDLMRALNAARGRYAAQLSEQRRRQGQEEAAYPRDTSCPEAVEQTSGNDKPGFAEHNPSPDSFYPPSSRRAEFEGGVTVKAWVTASGCMQKAAVYSSSGVPELDEAAIRWTEQARFRPAERDHRAADGVLVFIVRFNLTE
jgi:TonB family protein